MDYENAVLVKSKIFAVHIMKLIQHLTQNKRPFFIIDQIGRAGTSIGANIVEAEHAISKREFLQRMYISYKECNETLYWLELLYKSGYLSEAGYKRLSSECVELEKLLFSITKTTAWKLK